MAWIVKRVMVWWPEFHGQRPGSQNPVKLGSAICLAVPIKKMSNGKKQRGDLISEHWEEEQIKGLMTPSSPVKY